MKLTDKISDLGPEFYSVVSPAVFPQTIPRFLNHSCATELGLDRLLKTETDWIRYFAQFENLPKSLKQPLALKYHGHQFLHYNPDLGDGRGFLHAQIYHDKKLLDFGTKGSGTTPYSRQGDGRLTLKGAVREVLATEMLQRLGVNTSRSFCFFETGEELQRNDEPSPTRSAVLTRLSHSHIRIGTFERLAYLDQPENLRKLVQYCVENFYPQLLPIPDSTKLAQAFYSQVIEKLAELTSQWMVAGFVHGVLNTDNLNITGESFDYGPYRFLPTFDLNFTAAYFDHQGLYCYGRQAQAVHWGLASLGEALSKAYPDLVWQKNLEAFESHFQKYLQIYLLKRLALKSQGPEKDVQLLTAFFQFLDRKKVLFEQSFHDLRGGFNESTLKQSPQTQHYQGLEFESLATILKTYEPSTSMREKNSAQACSLLIDEIEKIWTAIATQDDWTHFQQKILQIREL